MTCTVYDLTAGTAVAVPINEPLPVPEGETCVGPNKRLSGQCISVSVLSGSGLVYTNTSGAAALPTAGDEIDPNSILPGVMGTNVNVTEVSLVASADMQVLVCLGDCLALSSTLVEPPPGGDFGGGGGDVTVELDSSCADPVWTQVCPPLDCVPYLASSIGDPAPFFEPFDTFSVVKPRCCEIVISTSAGSVVIPEGVESFTSPSFPCTISDLSVEGDCVDEVYIVVSREK